MDNRKFSMCRSMGYLPYVISCGKCAMSYGVMNGIMLDDSRGKWRKVETHDVESLLARLGWFYSLIHGYICPECYEKLNVKVSHPIGFDTPDD